jgi:predicted nucleotidyltransferase
MAAMEDKLNDLVNRLRDAAGLNLQSVILFGSAARGEARAGVSDLNILCTLYSAEIPKLADLAAVVSWWSGENHEPAPLFFTAEELRNSADVFVIEMLDMQKSHRVLFGPDVLDGITIPMNLHRVQLEHELRTAILRLRQHFLRGKGNNTELTAVLAKSASSINTLLRHTLLALGKEPPAAASEVFRQAAELTGADTEAIAAVHRLRGAKETRADIVSLYGNYLAALEKTVSVLDKLLPKREWQRSGATLS